MLSTFFFLRIALALQSLLWFRINVTIVFSISLKKCHWTLDRAESESIDGSGSADILKIFFQSINTRYLLIIYFFSVLELSV